MRFRILGPLEVLDGARSVRLGASKPRALLGVLLLHANEVVSTARLVDELWGERPPATAAKLVQGYVHALRKQLDADTLVTQAPGYRLRVDRDALDLHEFQRLAEEARSAPADARPSSAAARSNSGAGRRLRTSSSKARPDTRSGG